MLSPAAVLFRSLFLHADSPRHFKTGRKRRECPVQRTNGNARNAPERRLVTCQRSCISRNVTPLFGEDYPDPPAAPPCLSTMSRHLPEQTTRLPRAKRLGEGRRGDATDHVSRRLAPGRARGTSERTVPCPWPIERLGGAVFDVRLASGGNPAPPAALAGYVKRRRLQRRPSLFRDLVHSLSTGVLTKLWVTFGAGVWRPALVLDN